MNFRNVPLCLAPSFLHCVEAMAVTPRKRPIPIGPPPAGTRVVVESLDGVLTPELTIPFASRMLAHAADEGVGMVVLYINSPGGMIEGTMEAAEAVARCVSRKPVHVITEGYCASGAYWIASQAKAIAAAPSCLIGSLGVIHTIVDYSELAKESGAKVYSVATSDLKSLGVIGAPVTEEHLAMLGRLVDFAGISFEAAIERGRGLTGQALANVFNGDIWYAHSAKARGLVDRVELVDDAFGRIMSGVPVERYFDLRSADAHTKYLELANDGVAEESQADCIADVLPTRLAKLTKEYPKLAHEAANYEQSQGTNRGTPWRRGVN